jgi:hypothetical protein
MGSKALIKAGDTVFCSDLPYSLFFDKIKEEIRPGSRYPFIFSVAEKVSELYGSDGKIPEDVRERVATKLSRHGSFDDVHAMIDRVAASYNGGTNDLERRALAEQEVAQWILDDEICEKQITNRGLDNPCGRCLPDPLNRRCAGGYRAVPSEQEFFLPG